MKTRNSDIPKSGASTPFDEEPIPRRCGKSHRAGLQGRLHNGQPESLSESCAKKIGPIMMPGVHISQFFGNTEEPVIFSKSVSNTEFINRVLGFSELPL